MTKKEAITQLVKSKKAKETFSMKEIANEVGCSVARVHEFCIRDAEKPLIEPADTYGGGRGSEPDCAGAIRRTTRRLPSRQGRPL